MQTVVLAALAVGTLATTMLCSNPDGTTTYNLWEYDGAVAPNPGYVTFIESAV
jgi:hypothetical protein